jgi:DNA methylase
MPKRGESEPKSPRGLAGGLRAGGIRRTMSALPKRNEKNMLDFSQSLKNMTETQIGMTVPLGKRKPPKTPQRVAVSSNRNADGGNSPARPSCVNLREVKRRIVRRLAAAAGGTADYWDFRDHAEDLASEGLFQYPAMMVPALQKQIIISILHSQPNVRTMADPFLGSGTILALAMLCGRNFVGQDINPLAILIGKTRAFSLDHEELVAAVARVKKHISDDSSREYAAHFPRQWKWFTRGANIGLSRLRRAILKERQVNTRRFLWVCLAETVRLNSNSRTSTYKLHTRLWDDQNATTKGVLESFAKIAANNLDVVRNFREALSKSGHLSVEGNYVGQIKIGYGDTAASLPTAHWNEDGKYELIVTSPPYGDNRTTVPYGQAAWLPLQWIDIEDIDPGIPHGVAHGAYDIDNRSLGGVRSRHLKERIQILNKVGARTKQYMAELAAVSTDGLSRFVNFAYDFNQAVAQIVANCRQDSTLVFTLGNRNISGTVCPLSDVCKELLASHDKKEIVRIIRQIPSKRMPEKNGHSATINQEHISVFQQDGGLCARLSNE